MKAQYAANEIEADAPMDRTITQIDPVPRVSIQAFCESPDIAAVVSAAISDRRMAKAHVKQNMGGAPAAVEAYKSAPTPNVIVLEAPANRDALLALLEELAEYCDAGTKVVVLGKLNDIVLYRQLIARGVSEYLVAPFGVVDFIQAISQLFSVPGDQAPWASDRGRRRQGRRRSIHGRAQSRVGSGVAHRNGDDHRRFRSRVRNGGAGLQSGSAPGRRGGGVRARSRRRRAGGPPAFQVRRQA